MENFNEIWQNEAVAITVITTTLTAMSQPGYRRHQSLPVMFAGMYSVDCQVTWYIELRFSQLLFILFKYQDYSCDSCQMDPYGG